MRATNSWNEWLSRHCRLEIYPKITCWGSKTSLSYGKRHVKQTIERSTMWRTRGGRLKIRRNVKLTGITPVISRCDRIGRFAVLSPRLQKAGHPGLSRSRWKWAQKILHKPGRECRSGAGHQLVRSLTDRRLWTEWNLTSQWPRIGHCVQFLLTLSFICRRNEVEQELTFTSLCVLCQESDVLNELNRMKGQRPCNLYHKRVIQIVGWMWLFLVPLQIICECGWLFHCHTYIYHLEHDAVFLGSFGDIRIVSLLLFETCMRAPLLYV